MMSLLDWFNALDNAACVPDQSDGLGGGYFNAVDATYTCASNNYLHINKSFWTMTPNSSDNSGVWIIYGAGFVYGYTAFNVCGVRPAFYLSSNITFTKNGTSATPYEIE